MSSNPDVINGLFTKMDKALESDRPIIDTSFTLENFAAQGKATGDAIKNLSNEIDTLSVKKPVVVSSTSEMSNTSSIYVNTTDKNWYYYNGSKWSIGGSYQISQDEDIITELENRLKMLEGKRAVQTTFDNDIVTETYDDGSYKVTMFKNNKTIENWYSNDGVILYSKSREITTNSVIEL